jgi:hypothetical protein
MSEPRVAFLAAIEAYRCAAVIFKDQPYPHRARCPRAVQGESDLCRKHAETVAAGGEVLRVKAPERLDG